MSLTKCSECNILPTHHKCIICKVALVCPECCDKRGIDDLNMITCKDCQTREAGIALTQLSDSVTLTVNSSRNENNREEEADLTVEIESITVTEQTNVQQEISPPQVNAPVGNIQVDSQSQDMSSLESLTQVPVPINTNTNGQVFTSSSTGSALSSVNAPQVRTYGIVNEDMYEEGYDSDGECGPFYDAVADSSDVEEVPNEPSTQVNAVMPSNSLQHTIDDIRKMTVNQLKETLGSMNRPKSGNKAILVDRLIEAVQNPTPLLNNTEPTPTPSSPWELLVPNSIPVRFNANNRYTDPSGNNQNAKFNYDIEFDRPEFKLTFEHWERTGRSKMLKKDTQGKPVVKTDVRKHGVVSMKWLVKNKLTMSSHPIDFLDAMMMTNEIGVNGKRISMYDKWTRWTNIKAILMGAGEGPDSLYPDFVPFTTAELKQHIGLYILNGISPSPNINQKFQSQKEDPVNGCDIVSQAILNGPRRHRHFRCFFTIYDPRVHPPRKSVQPNFKVDSFFAHINDVSLEAWLPGPQLSVDEQVQRFTGKGSGTRRCKFKREGDGFFMDTVCDSGYTITFYPRNQPPPSSFISKGYCPLHARVLFMLDQLEENGNYEVYFDNLYTALKLTIGAKVDTKSKCSTHGVCRSSGRGLPSMIMMDNPSNKQQREALVGTTKAAILRSNDNCPNIVAFCVFDQKPVYFLSTTMKNITWLSMQKKVYDPNLKKLEKLTFLRTNAQDDYNNNMNGVDIADQFRGHYRMDKWCRNNKWWMALWYWGYGNVNNNALRTYESANIDIWLTCEKGSKRQNLHDHYTFRKASCLAMIDPDGKYHDILSYGTINGFRQKRSATVAFKPWDCVEYVRSSSKAIRVNDKSLDPENGMLNIRLVTELNHIPKADDRDGVSTKCCALCRWATGKQLRARLMTCSICHVNLCVSCYHIFHTESIVKKMKKAVEKHQNEKMK